MFKSFDFVESIDLWYLNTIICKYVWTGQKKTSRHMTDPFSRQRERHMTTQTETVTFMTTNPITSPRRGLDNKTDCLTDWLTLSCKVAWDGFKGLSLYLINFCLWNLCFTVGFWIRWHLYVKRQMRKESRLSKNPRIKREFVITSNILTISRGWLQMVTDRM